MNACVLPVFRVWVNLSPVESVLPHVGQIMLTTWFHFNIKSSHHLNESLLKIRTSSKVFRGFTVSSYYQTLNCCQRHPPHSHHFHHQPLPPTSFTVPWCVYVADPQESICAFKTTIVGRETIYRQGNKQRGRNNRFIAARNPSDEFYIGAYFIFSALKGIFWRRRDYYMYASKKSCLHRQRRKQHNDEWWLYWQLYTFSVGYVQQMFSE